MKTILDYADLVKEQHALNTTIAPVETDLTSASKTYAVGQKFIHDGVLYQAKTPIAQGAALVLNTNYEAADDVSSEIQTLTNKLDNEVETRARLGVHNLAKNIRGVITYGGITYTPNADGSVTATCEGARSSSYDLVLRGEKSLYLPNGTYVLSGGIDSNNYVICGCTKNGNWHEYTRSTGEESIFTVNGDDNTNDGAYLTVAIYAYGTDLNETFYPMICLASDPSTEYTPYAMTNRELTEDIIDLNNSWEFFTEPSSTSPEHKILETTLMSDLLNGHVYYMNGASDVLWNGYNKEVFVMKNNPNNGVEIAVKLSNTSNNPDVSSEHFAYRICYNNIWSNWTKLTGTNVT